MVICDEDQEYAARLVDYLNLKDGFPFDVRCFSELDQFLNFEKKQRVELLLCSMEIGKELPYESNYKRILLEDHYDEFFNEWDRLWKYQSCEEMISSLMEILSKAEMEYNHLCRKRNLKMIGFYTPVKRSLQTTFAITLGEHLGKREKCLYINMESNSGIRNLLNLNFKKDLSDILYDLQLSKKGSEFYLVSVVSKYNNLFIMPDMENHNDLIGVSENEWMDFLKKIEVETDFEYLLLDLSDGVRGLYEILQQCNRIYEMQIDSEISLYKIEQYHKQLKLSGYEEVLKKIIECKPSIETGFKKPANKITNMEFDEYVKAFCKDEVYAINESR